MEWRMVLSFVGDYCIIGSGLEECLGFIRKLVRRMKLGNIV